MTQIDELVKMGDRETLNELMTEDGEWFTRLEAAEGLVELGDRRGYEFLLIVTMGDDDEMIEVANEILASPELAKMKREIEAERDSERRVHIESAKKRLQRGGKIYRYKMVYLPASAVMSEDPLGKGFEIPALSNHGLDGWEVVNLLPARRSLLVGSVAERDHFSGVYFLLKKEILPDESVELETP